jgi:PAS domain S-box-containing protein
MALGSIEALAFPAQILDQAHDSVIATDLDGRITFWNNGAERLFGYNADESVGQHISHIFPAEAHADLDIGRLAPLLERGFQEDAATVRTKAGRSLMIYARFSLLRD